MVKKSKQLAEYIPEFLKQKIHKLKQDIDLENKNESQSNYIEALMSVEELKQHGLETISKLDDVTIDVLLNAYIHAADEAINEKLMFNECAKQLNIDSYRSFQYVKYFYPRRVIDGTLRDSKSWTTEADSVSNMIKKISSNGLTDTINNKLSIEVSKNLFKSITRKIIITSILEAELIKLFSNAWRYINFAASNQFFMICQNFGIDFKKIRNF